jgi:hypothetical protein
MCYYFDTICIFSFDTKCTSYHGNTLGPNVIVEKLVEILDSNV